MRNKKWKKFAKLTDKCYANMAGAESDASCWPRAFDLLMEILAEERANNPQYAPELVDLEEETDWAYDISGWMEDYLDELDMREEHELLLHSCDQLIQHFRWKEDSPEDFYFLKSTALSGLDRTQEAAAFCRAWMQERPDSFTAVAASIYAFLDAGELQEAEALMKKHIDKDAECTDETAILFTAASKYYERTGNLTEHKRMEDALEAYDSWLEEEWLGGEDDEDGDALLEDWELPFN